MVTNKDSVRIDAELVVEDQGNGTPKPDVVDTLDIDGLWEEAVGETEALRKKLDTELEAQALEEVPAASAEPEAGLDSLDDRWIKLETIPLEVTAEQAEPAAESQQAPEVQVRPAPVVAVKEPKSPKVKAQKSDRPQGTGMLGWFLGAALVGGILGAIIMALVLSGINGGLSYVSSTGGVQMQQEQARLSGDLTELTRDLATVENELANLSGLPAEMATLSGNVTALRRDLDATITGLEELGVSLNDVSQNLSTLDGQVVSLSTSLGELAAEAETLQKQATALETTVGELGTSVDQMSEQMDVLAESKAKFDGFIDGLRALVGE